MALRPRSHQPLCLAAGRRRLGQARRGWLAAIAAFAALACMPSAASAQIATVEGVTVGLQHRNVGELYDHKAFGEPANAAGNPVLASSSTYVVYWDPRDLYHGDWQHLINGFMRNMGLAKGMLNTVFAVDSQYTDAAGDHAARSTSFKGSYTDTSAYPAAECTDPQPLIESDAVTCLTDAQIRAELQKFITDHSLPTGMGTVYYVLTPPGVTACLDGTATSCSDYSGPAEETNASYASSFCSYHSDVNPGPGELGGPETILYAVVPWTAGGLGDYHLLEKDRTPAYNCQAGGWEPVNESPPEKEEKAFTQQEPNQIGLGPDGSYDTGLADLIVNQIGVEQQNTATDPLLNSWHDESGAEITDECRNYFAPAISGSSAAQQFTGAGTLSNQSLGEGKYYLNDAYNLADERLPYPSVTHCLNGISLAPSFTTPNIVNAGELVGFDGMESDITLNAGTAYEAGEPKPTYAIYEWSFGDGTTVTGFAPGAPSAGSLCEAPWIAPCAASAFHSYAYGGTYLVTLKITDTGGNVASVTKPVSVVGPPPPPPASPPSPSPSPSGSPSSGTKSSTTSGGTTSKTGSTTTTGTKPAAPPLPRPVATAMVMTGSLTEALHGGLPVRYSVNQQVAGHFELLIPTRLAKRLGIKGPSARGLAPGAAPQTRIAYALLVTMRKAHGSIRISIPSATAARLGRLRQLTVTLRLVVRNADPSKPKLTLLQTVAKLSR